MKKVYFISFIGVLIASIFSTNAQQVTGMPAGYITVAPTISTAANPVWYNLMATNTDAARVNRYLYYDGTNLKTDGLNSGISDEIQHDKYLWRLEQGASEGYVKIINKSSGKQLFLPTTAGTNSIVTVADGGINWKIASSVSISGSLAVTGQYAFNYEGGADNRFLNAGDGISMNWGVLSFNATGSTSKSSGWFFYPVTTTKTITYTQPEDGSISVTATNGTPTPAPVASTGNVLVGTLASVCLTPVSGYTVSTLNVNGVDVTSSIIDGVYKFTVNTNTTITANYSLTTGTVNSEIKKGISPNPFRNELKINNKLERSKIILFDITCKIILESEDATLNTSPLQKGTYIIKYETAEGSKTEKAIKE